MAAATLLLTFAIFAIMSTHSRAYTPADNYLIDCGSSTNTTVGSRVFLADASLSSTLTTSQNILASTNNSVPSSSSPALYQTARIFTGPSSYSFRIQAGRHFIRLHFFPFVFQTYNLSAASFSVSTQDAMLLKDFQPQANSAVMKEYSLNLTQGTLILSFAPSGNTSLAFINAVEVVSVPDYLIVNSVQTINRRGTYQGVSGMILETFYRINMGGPQVSPDGDTLSRSWNNDDKFLNNVKLTKNDTYSGKIQYISGGPTQETAPDIVYGTARELASSSNTSSAQFNVTWQFDVDASSSYLMRFHFCDIVSSALNQLYFNVYVGNWMVANDLDLSTLVSTLASPYILDRVLEANDASGKLSVSIGPSTLTGVLPDGILNGLEILKMYNSSGSVVVAQPSKKNVGIILGLVLGAAALVIVVVVLILLCRRRKEATRQDSKTWMPFSINGLTSLTTGSKASRSSNGTISSSGQNGSLGFRFSVLQEATNNFDENLVIGVGGFGKVYKGVLRDETKVAVKRGNPRSQQGFNEFRTEIELLSRLRHRHLVSLIGYCDEKNEMILVYEYMEKGTLKSHLYGSGLPSLPWNQRLEICIGAARGLHYLHTGQTKAIIHRDVKSANILLDENLLAKVADFGLSKTGPELDQTHVSTAVKGSFGYLDPEYFRRQQLTDKSDVYSFGVVLLEVLCARPVIDPTLPRDMVNLADWGIKWQKRGELGQIVDPRIAGSIKPESLRKFGETIEKCLADSGVERPSMGDVLWNLEYTLQLQQVDSDVSDINSMNRVVELASQVRNINTSESAAAREVGTLHVNDNSDISMSKVFSQLIKSEGR